MLRLTYSVGLLSCVNAQVALQGLQVAETCAAGVAGVRLLSGVDQNMGPQVSNLTPGKTRRQNKYGNASHFFFEEVDIRLCAFASVESYCTISSLDILTLY